MARVAPLQLDLDDLARSLTASRDMADLLATDTRYHPTMRVDIDLRYAWLARAFDEAVAARGQTRRAWTPVNQVKRRGRWRLPAGVFESAEAAAIAWGKANGLRMQRSGRIVDRQRRRVALGWDGLARQLEDGRHIVRLSNPGTAHWVVPSLAPTELPDAAQPPAAEIPDQAAATMPPAVDPEPEAVPTVRRCPHCGEARRLELLEVWGNDFQLDACCEAMLEEAHWTLAHDPDDAAGLMLELDVAGHVGRGVRSLCDDGRRIVINHELEVRPVDQKTAKRFIDDHHEHCAAPAGWRFGAGLYNGGILMGVVWVGRPVGRGLCQRTVVEVNRLCLRRDFPPEMRYRGCSLGYRWAQREAQRRGFQRIVTYTLIQENGYSLRAARWKPETRVRGRSWNCPSRPRLDRAPPVNKIRWSPGPLQRTVVSVS